MTLPSLPLMTSAGLRLAVRGLERQSMTMRLAMPVASSICSDIEAPSVRSSKPTTPSTSERIGRVKGSHSASRWPRLIWSPSSTLRRAPYCTRWTARSAPPLSTTTIATLRAIAIRSPFALRATLRLRIRTTPSKFDSMNDWSASCAAPPMWKVRMVSWVPGSPIDCAAMTPTASPMLTGVPRARSRP